MEIEDIPDHEAAHPLIADPPPEKKTVSKTYIALALSFLCGTVTICLALGASAVYLVKPFPVLDKSVDAFRIPTHKTSLHYDALILAGQEGYRIQRDMTRLKRHHRSLSQQVYNDLSVLGYTSPFGKPSSGILLPEYQHQESKDEAIPWIRKILKREKRHSWDFKHVYYQRIARWKMQIIYVAEGEDQNIFTPDRLETIHKIEHQIMNHPEYKNFCLKGDSNHNLDSKLRKLNGCLPLNSLLTYFYPSRNVDGTVFYDGLGSNIDNIESAIKLAMTKDTFYFYVDDKINKTYHKSKLLRTEVLFGAPLHGFKSWWDHKEEQTKKYKDFVITYIDMLQSSSTENLVVLYGGNEIFDFEVSDTFWNDCKLAWISLTCIGLFMLVLTSLSLWLTFWGLVSIAMSLPLAFFFYRVIFGEVALGILTGAALFLIIGIGVDDVFVFINVFRQSAHTRDVKARLIYTIKTAGKATFFTSFTTAAAFAANVASSIPAIHDFGLFMSLIVSSCWVTVALIMPSALFFWHCCFNVCESSVSRAFCKSYTVPELPTDISQFMEGNNDQALEQPDEETDVPLLAIAGLQVAPNLDVDEELLLPLEEEEIYAEQCVQVSNLVHVGIRNATEEREGFPITKMMQSALYYCVAIVIIKARWIILGFFVLVLVVSVGLMTQLHVATKPPQLFGPSTNLQRLLDLKANLSLEMGVTCDQCSALFKVPPSRHSNKVPPPSAKLTVAIGTTQRLMPFNLSQPVVFTSSPSPLLTWKLNSTVTTTTTTTTTKQYQSTTKNKVINKLRGGSVNKGFNVCQDDDCKKLKDRPNLGSGAVVHVVFGIIGVDRSNVTVEHVINENRGKVIYDNAFLAAFFDLKNIDGTLLTQLCDICTLIAHKTALVKNGTAQCLPDGIPKKFKQYLHQYEKCRNLPGTIKVYGHQAPAPAMLGKTKDGRGLKWLAFAFESTTPKSQSYFEAYKQYLKWEQLMEDIRSNLPEGSPLHSIFQVSSFWKKVMMEVVVVTSAIYSLVLSMVICIVAITVFTGHLMLVLIIVLTILGIICLVVAIFYLAGWEMGAVEAVSLSILVGSSVDYCVHLVEGYLLVGKNPPTTDSSAKKTRQWRTRAAIAHIGVSIVSSAVTTVIAAIPLTQTVIQPFSKFGDIITINTSVAIFYTLTVCPALLSTIAPARFKSSWKASGIAFLCTGVVIGLLVLILYGVSRHGIVISGPSGNSLFPK